MAKAAKVGRPSDYKPEHCATVLDLGRTGASKAEMAHALGCSRPTMDSWADSHPEFLYALKEALDAAQGWWEQQGRIATFGGVDGFNATAYIFQMKNRFKDDWRDKQEVEQSGGVAVTHHGAVAISDTAAFITDALAGSGGPAPSKPRKN